MVSWGLLTPSVVQHAMLLLLGDLEAASRGDLDMSLIKNLSKAGNFGQDQQNLAKRFWQAVPTIPQLGSQTINVPLVSLGHTDFHSDMGMILPHELFAIIYHYYKDYFFKYIVPGVEILKKFWKQVSGCARL
jgi:hypothetical protein